MELRAPQIESALALPRHRSPHWEGVGLCVRTAQGHGLSKAESVVEPFGITRYYTDGWGAYERHLDSEKHCVGKDKTHKIESKHINLRTRIKRLVRRTICFSKTEHMHDLVIGIFITRYEFGRAI